MTYYYIMQVSHKPKLQSGMAGIKSSLIYIAAMASSPLVFVKCLHDKRTPPIYHSAPQRRIKGTSRQQGIAAPRKHTQNFCTTCRFYSNNYSIVRSSILCLEKLGSSFTNIYCPGAKILVLSEWSLPARYSEPSGWNMTFRISTALCIIRSRLNVERRNDVQ